MALAHKTHTNIKPPRRRPNKRRLRKPKDYSTSPDLSQTHPARPHRPHDKLKLRPRSQELRQTKIRRNHQRRQNPEPTETTYRSSSKQHHLQKKNAKTKTRPTPTKDRTTPTENAKAQTHTTTTRDRTAPMPVNARDSNPPRTARPANRRATPHQGYFKPP